MSKFYYIIFAVFMLVSCKSEAEKIAEENTARNAIIDSLTTSFLKKIFKEKIDSVFAKYQFNGSVSVFQNDDLFYEKENGLQDFSAKTKIDSSTIFAIGSISKQFTGVLVLIQEEAGTLKTDDKVSKFIPDFQNKQFENITIKELLNHTSGISDFGDGLLSKPGTDFHYSNKGYRILGEIIEKASGKSYDENAHELFTKAGMKNSFTAYNFQIQDFGSAYLGNAKHFEKIQNMPKRLANPEISVPAGGILSTVSDLHRWNNALYNGSILKPESMQKFLTKSSSRKHPYLGQVGYGFGIMINDAKPLSYFHSGYVKGSPSLNIYYPENKTSVIILSNIADENKGKEAVFYPHTDIKKIADEVEKLVSELKKARIETVAIQEK